MNTLQDIFNYYDVNNNKFIDAKCFKQIINLFELQINNIQEKQYTYDDLHAYIQEKKANNNTTKRQIIKITKDEIRQILSNYLNNADVIFIISVLFKNQPTNSINLDELLTYPNIMPNH